MTAARWLAAVLGLALIAVTVGFAAPASAATTLSFVSIADTFTNSGNQTTNFGTSNILRAAAAPSKVSYFKFDPEGIPAGATGITATLTLTGSGTQPADPLDVYSISNSWDETTLYATKPALGAKVGTVNMPANGGTVSVSVPVTGNGIVSFAVTKVDTATPDNIISSREAATGKPSLAVTYTGSAPTQTDLTVDVPGVSGDNQIQNVKVGDVVHFNGNWHVNDLATTSATRLEWYVDNADITNTAYVPEPVGAYGSLSQGTWTATAGTHTLLFIADPLNTIAESNENNNTASVTFTVLTNDQAANAKATSYGFTNCSAATQTQVRPFTSGTNLSTQWKVVSPPNNTTYDLTGVTSTAYPSAVAPFMVGSTTPAAGTCIVGGTMNGTTDDNVGWQTYHDNYNAPCDKMTATNWEQVRNQRCHDIEDGLRLVEPAVNGNTTSFFSSGTYLSHVRDDCMENDYTLGGVLYDSLWESCNTGLSERPSGSQSWTSPANESVTLDHMLIGLYSTCHFADGFCFDTGAIWGENSIFKWSTSANKLVIKCSVFKVDSKSLNGANDDDIPAGTVIDDSACPNNPTTLVWLGAGAYPGNLNGVNIQVSTDVNVWNTAVANWKAAHGY